MKLFVRGCCPLGCMDTEYIVELLNLNYVSPVLQGLTVCRSVSLTCWLGHTMSVDNSRVNCVPFGLTNLLAWSHYERG